MTDVASIHTQQGWAYLSAIQDLYDGFIVAYQIGHPNSMGLVNRTLHQDDRPFDLTQHRPEKFNNFISTKRFPMRAKMQLDLVRRRCDTQSAH